jgi:hypothetical protein
MGMSNGLMEDHDAIDVQFSIAAPLSLDVPARYLRFEFRHDPKSLILILIGPPSVIFIRVDVQ